MMERNDETKLELTEARSYESPSIRTHKREELVARALPINAATSPEDPIGG